MGQPVAVTEKRTKRADVIRFETNRNLTGMGHERFTSIDQAVGSRPAALLARRLFETGKLDAVHVYGNVVTVDLAKGCGPEGLREVVENLYVYYTPGFVLPTFEEAAAEDSDDGGAASGDGGGGGGGEEGAGDAALSEAAKRIPAQLLERSRAALARKKGGG